MLKKRVAGAVAPLLLLPLLTICLTSCSSDGQDVTLDATVITYTDIDVVVTEIANKRTWVANVYGYRVYAMSITIYSREYELEKTFEISGGGVGGKPQQWDYKVGDSVKAQLSTEALESTGAIVRRDIIKIY